MSALKSRAGFGFEFATRVFRGAVNGLGIQFGMIARYWGGMMQSNVQAV